MQIALTGHSDDLPGSAHIMPGNTGNAEFPMLTQAEAIVNPQLSLFSPRFLLQGNLQDVGPDQSRVTSVLMSV